jgi:hypothetical protein
MGSKRDQTQFEDEDSTKLPPKRAKYEQSSKARQHQNSHIDPTWGQKYVFSGLEGDTTIPKDEELDFEDDADAMQYLRTVR